VGQSVRVLSHPTKATAIPEDAVELGKNVGSMEPALASARTLMFHPVPAYHLPWRCRGLNHRNEAAEVDGQIYPRYPGA
jgi:hypothetical protein